MRKMSYLCLAYHMDDKHVPKLRKLFSEIDKGCQGFITPQELKDYFKGQENHSKKDELEQVIKSFTDICDLNNNDVIDYLEFIAATVRK